MTWLEFMLLAPTALFVIVNPLSVAPAFLSMTPTDSADERIRMARTASLLAGSIMFAFAVGGHLIFQFMGITLPAFQIGGGILLFVIGFEMTRAPDIDVRLTEVEKKLAVKKEDVAVTPLAVPLLCGPGAISTVVILQSHATTSVHTLILLVTIPIFYAVVFGLLVTAVHTARWINPIALRVTKRLMGLLFVVMAVQFVINGVFALF